MVSPCRETERASARECRHNDVIEKAAERSIPYGARLQLEHEVRRVSTNGAIAQLGERSVRNGKVEGSNPFGSTIS